MTSRLPHLALLHRYGNEEVFLKKAAGELPLAFRLMGGLKGVNESINEMERERRLRAQAEAMNVAMARLEAAKMRPVSERAYHTRPRLILFAGRPGEDPEIGLGPASDGLGLGPSLYGTPRMLQGKEVPVGMDEGMVRIASAIGADLAVYSFDKEAGIGSALSGAFKGIGGAAKGLAGSAGKAYTAAGPRLRAAGRELLTKGINTAKEAPGKAKSWAVGKLESAADTASKAFDATKLQVRGGIDAAKRDIQGAVQSVQDFNKNMGRSIQRSTNRVVGGVENVGQKIEQLGTGQASMTPRSAAQRQLAAEQRLARMKQKGITPGGKVQPPSQPHGQVQPPAQSAAQQPPPLPQPQQAQPGASPQGQVRPPQPPGQVQGPSQPGDLEKFWDRSGLSGGQWKWKVPVLAAGALGAYGLYRGAKAGLDILGHESSPYQYGNPQAMPAYGVNQYGVPDRSTPFTG